MRTDMTYIETWTLPADHPVKVAEREKAAEWHVDFTREGELGFVAVNKWVAIESAAPDIVFVEEAA